MSLFIGGPFDGQRKHVDLSCSIHRIAEYPPLSPVGEMKNEELTLEVTLHHYLYTPMTNGFHVFIHESMKPEDVVPALIAGYRQPKAV